MLKCWKPACGGVIDGVIVGVGVLGHDFNPQKGRNGKRAQRKRASDALRREAALGFFQGWMASSTSVCFASAGCAFFVFYVASPNGSPVFAGLPLIRRSDVARSRRSGR